MAALTVRELMAQLAAANPDLPVVVECENRCDPHPVQAVHVVVQTEDEDMIRPGHVSLFQNSREDFEVRQWKVQE